MNLLAGCHSEPFGFAQGKLREEEGSRHSGFGTSTRNLIGARDSAGTTCIVTIIVAFNK
jgi:hypothetical protein